MGTVGSAGTHSSAGPSPRASAAGEAPRPTRSLISKIEELSPYAAGSLLLGTGVYAAGHALGLAIPPGPLGDSPWPVAMLVGASGAGIILSAWDNRRTRIKLKRAREDVQRANAQRDVAMLQSRRMRAQAEGLALMREIHRSTGIPVRQERLHRILTLLADLFEAREVSLFAVAPDYSANSNCGPRSKVQPAACIRTTNKEEFFAVFDSDDLLQAISAMDSNANLSAVGTRTAKRWLRVTAKSATIVREGRQLFVEGSLECQGIPVAKAQWRRGAQAEQDALSQFDPGEILDTALAKLDLSEAAIAFAAEALDRRRTTRQEEHLNPTQSGATDGMTLCVPLLADQKPIGVLRIRRSIEGFSGPEAGALEELLLESAKHIALALKKDEDDRKAITDVLTGLFIKRHFLVTLEQMRAETAGSGNGFCLVLCDIDHFKKVNDTHGHLSGDMILKGVAGVLRKCLRTGDTAFRYGGEEMALLLPNATPDSAEQTAERLRAAVQGATFNGERGQRVPVTISLGISQHQPGLTGESLISRADRALYASKQGGRNRSTRWSAELPDPLAAPVAAAKH